MFYGLGVKRVGVIDIGSNSIKVLVAERGEAGIRMVAQKTIETRIGGAFDGGPIPEERWEAALVAIGELRQVARENRAEVVRVVGTSAVRDAGNQEALAASLKRETGLDLEILSGEEEAFFIGRGIATDPHWRGCGDFGVMDQGGGSLEVILFSSGRLHQALSLPLGAVRLFQRYQVGRSGPLRGDLLDTCSRDCDQVLKESGLDWELAASLPWAGTGGAFTMLRVVRAREQEIAFEQTEPWLSISSIGEMMHRLAGMTLEERVEVAGLPPNRADIMPISLVPVLGILRRVHADRIMHSFHNLRYGLAEEMLEGRDWVMR